VHYRKVKRKSTTLLGYVRHLPRFPASRQEAKLLAHGVDDLKIHVEGRGGKDGESLARLIELVRRGETVVVTHLHLLAPPKTQTNSRPRVALWTAIKGVEAKGGSVFELESGRSTANKSERDDMIAEAIEAITHSGRSPRKRNGSGRPPVAFTVEEIEFAQRQWFDLRHRTNEAALKAIRRRVPNWTLKRCYDKSKGFGPSGRQS
jgi:hypothetical protein